VSPRRKSLIEALADWLSEEAHLLSMLSETLHEFRQALDRLSRELIICLAFLLCLWHQLADLLGRLLGR
jgi:hypothetical protein